MLLMNRFYGNLLKRKMPKAESLREAQLYLRGLTGGEVAKKIDSEGMQEHFDSKPYEAHQDEKPFSDPKFWGAFICIGDPGPLT
jgi:CHAT domain-containing protein